MKKELSADYNTIFGKDYSVVICIAPSQDKGHISLLVNPEDAEKVKRFIIGIKDNYHTLDHTHYA